MNLQVIIENRYKNSIKSKNLDEVNTLRLIKNAIKNKEIENRTSKLDEEINDQQILTLLQTLIKQRKDSIESFKIASREDLIAIEQFEIDLISQFLPQQLNEQETKIIVKKIIDEKNLSSLKDMSILMNNLKANHSGSIDIGMAGRIAKTLLNN